MGHKFEFWAHGVAVVPERTREFTNTDNGLLLTRMGYGARARQRAGTDNWFHLPIPTASQLDNDSVNLHFCLLRVGANEFAEIDIVRLHHTSNDFETEKSKIIFNSESVPLTELPIHNESRQLPVRVREYRVYGAITVSMHVNFWGDDNNREERPMGEVVFYGAGIRFLEL